MDTRPKSNAMFRKEEGVENVKSQLFFFLYKKKKKKCTSEHENLTFFSEILYRSTS